MRNTIFFAFALPLLASTCFAQPSIQWSRSYGCDNDDEAYSIRQTTDGGYIIAGNYNYWPCCAGGACAFPLDSFTLDDYLILKITSSGATTWHKVFGGNGRDYAKAILQTLDGGYIVAGYTNSNEGNVSGNHGSYDYWVVKTDSLGTLIWQKCFGGSNDDKAFAIQNTTDGGFIIAGYTKSNDGDVLGWHEAYASGNPYSDYWIVKIDSLGNFEWQKCLGGYRDDIATSIDNTPEGGYIIAGYSKSRNDGDVSGHHGLSGDNYDYWVVKTNSVGSIEWQKSLGGTGDDVAKAIKATSDAGFIVVGYTNTSNNGDVTGIHIGSYDFWIVKLTYLGNIEWAKCYGGSGEDLAFSISNTLDNGYIIAGYTTSNNGDVTGLHGVNDDYWIVKLDFSGDLEWQKCLGGIYDDRAQNIIQTSDSGFIVAGWSKSYSCGPDKNYWIVALSPCSYIPSKIVIDSVITPSNRYLPINLNGSEFKVSDLIRIKGHVLSFTGTGCPSVPITAYNPLLWDPDNPSLSLSTIYTDEDGYFYFPSEDSFANLHTAAFYPFWFKVNDSLAVPIVIFAYGDEFRAEYVQHVIDSVFIEETESLYATILPFDDRINQILGVSACYYPPNDSFLHNSVNDEFWQFFTTVYYGPKHKPIIDTLNFAEPDKGWLNKGSYTFSKKCSLAVGEMPYLLSEYNLNILGSSGSLLMDYDPVNEWNLLAYGIEGFICVAGIATAIGAGVACVPLVAHAFKDAAKVILTNDDCQAFLGLDDNEAVDDAIIAGADLYFFVFTPFSATSSYEKFYSASNHVERAYYTASVAKGGLSIVGVGRSTYKFTTHLSPYFNEGNYNGLYIGGLEVDGGTRTDITDFHFSRPDYIQSEIRAITPHGDGGFDMMLEMNRKSFIVNAEHVAEPTVSSPHIIVDGTATSEEGTYVYNPISGRFEYSVRIPEDAQNIEIMTNTWCSMESHTFGGHCERYADGNYYSSYPYGRIPGYRSEDIESIYFEFVVPDSSISSSGIINIQTIEYFTVSGGCKNFTSIPFLRINAPSSFERPCSLKYKMPFPIEYNEFVVNYFDSISSSFVEMPTFRYGDSAFVALINTPGIYCVEQVPKISITSSEMLYCSPTWFPDPVENRGDLTFLRSPDFISITNNSNDTLQIGLSVDDSESFWKLATNIGDTTHPYDTTLCYYNCYSISAIFSDIEPLETVFNDTTTFIQPDTTNWTATGVFGGLEYIAPGDSTYLWLRIDTPPWYSIGEEAIQLKVSHRVWTDD